MKEILDRSKRHTKSNLQQTVEIGNPIPEAQPNPSQHVAFIAPQGPPRNTTPCLKGQFEKHDKPEG